MTHLTIQKKTEPQNNETGTLLRFQSYKVHSWSPLQIEESEAQIFLRTSEIKDYFFTHRTSIFNHEIVVPHPNYIRNLGYYWSIYALACSTLTTQDEESEEALSNFYALLSVIRQYSKIQRFTTEVDLFLLDLCTYSMAFCKRYGLGTEKNKNKALKYLKSASNLSSTPNSEFLKLADQLGINHQKPKKKPFLYPDLGAEESAQLAQIISEWPLNRKLDTSLQFRKKIHLYKKAAKQNDMDAQCILAISYHLGDGVQKSPQRAFSYFQMAAKNGHPMAQYYLGRYYQEGFGCDQNIELALTYYRLAANQADRKAQYRLGLYYLQQTDTQGPGLDIALSYLKLSADNGHRDAQYRIATFYSTGYGYSRNPIKAFYYYLLSATQGYAKAQNNLGCFYFEGTDCPLDYKLALELFERSAAQGFPLAHRNAGYCFLHALGVKKNLLKALEHFEEYERLDPQESEYESLSYQCKAHIAFAFHTGDGLKKNMKMAFELFNQLTREPPKYTDPRKIYYKICVMLGFLYQNGYVDQDVIIPIDLKKAVSLFQTADLYQPIALYRIAEYSRTGLTWQGEVLVQRNLYSYITRLKNAAKEGLKIACFDLAAHYEKGLKGPQNITIVDKDLQKAIQLYTKADCEEDVIRCLNLLMSIEEEKCS